MEFLGLVVIAVLLAVIAVLLVQRRNTSGPVAAGARRSPGRRRRAAPAADPMAAAVSSHGEAMDASDVAVEEMRVRAQANRVAAATHEREAVALGNGAGQADDETRRQAESHHGAAVQYQRTADELEARAPTADPHDTGPGNPFAPGPLPPSERYA